MNHIDTGTMRRLSRALHCDACQYLTSGVTILHIPSPGATDTPAHTFLPISGYAMCSRFILAAFNRIVNFCQWKEESQLNR